jgi:hypothetical protein
MSTYRLKDGTLALELMEYQFCDGVVADEVNEVLRGDFCLELRVWFLGDVIRVSFRNGLVSLDRSTWRFSPGLPLSGRRSKQETKVRNVAKPAPGAASTHIVH